MAGLTVLLISQSSFSVFASTMEELEAQKNEILQEKKNNQAQLNSVKKQVNSLSGAMGTLQADMEELDAEMVAIFTDINLIEQAITDKEAQIIETQGDYEAACAEVDRQYASMKIRVKYLYEKGDHTYLDLFLASENFSDALTKADYVEKLYEYDRQMLEKYEEAVETAKAIWEKLEEEKSELETSRQELEEEQEYLSQLLEEKQEAYADYEVMLSRAKQEAAAYTAKINQQTSQIREIEKQEEKKRQEEEARRKAEEEAKKKAEEEAKKKAQESENGTTSDSTTATDDKTDDGQRSDAGNSSGAAASGQSTASSKGQQIAQYACQFIGNPYVAGGVSLTNGADCSGFTQSVYKNFGISLPRRSADQANVGKAVSYAEIQPGDLIYYGGHVGIYIGNGQIVHASTQRTGIKISNALYRSIVTVRRVV